MDHKLKRRELLAAAARLPILMASMGAIGGRVLASGGAALDTHQAATLQRVAWLLFPFPELDQSAYERIVDSVGETLAGDPEQLELVRTGIESLDALAGGAFVDLDESQQLAILKEIEAGGFFGFSLQATQSRLFNDRELWKLVGYEGSSLEFGGYLEHGLEDIDWLPEGTGHE